MDINKLLLYSGNDEFIKKIPLEINCYNLKAIDEDNFLISASGEEYIIYLINRRGDIISKELKRDNRSILGISVVFFALGNNQILYQQDFSNDFLSFNTQTKEFTNINLLRDEEESILSIKTIKEDKNRDKIYSGLDISSSNDVKLIRGLSSYTDYMFFALGTVSKSTTKTYRRTFYCLHRILDTHSFYNNNSYYFILFKTTDKHSFSDV